MKKQKKMKVFSSYSSSLIITSFYLIVRSAIKEEKLIEEL
jgi:hypothetical protein